MVSLIQNNLQQIQEILKDHKVLTAEVFGSALKSNFNSTSDIDILVTFSDNINLLDYSDNYFDLKIKLEDLLGRNVDLVSSKSLKNPILIESINSSKVNLYAA